jgi:PAS domain S-box-containing protein
MGKVLRVLVIEDSEVDAMLIGRELRRGGFEPEARRVETADQMTAALNEQEWDLIISDYALPQFGGSAALALFQEKNLDLPFIIVSGAMGEERAVEMMKAGAHDYVLKHNLPRLVPAVSRELAAAEQRRVRRQNEATVAYLASIVSSCQDAIVGMTPEGIVVSWNAGAETLYGYTAAEMIGKSVTTLLPANRPKDFPDIQEIGLFERVERFETVRIRKNGLPVEVALTISPLKDPQGKTIGASSVAVDISKRKREEAEWMKLIQELTDALAHVKTLSGLLPICASCKKIRDDKGYWQQVETYIKDRSDADFTHGICPECVKRLYPEYQLKSVEITAAPN